MWTYIRSSGVLLHAAAYVGVGYAGKELATNNANCSDIKDVGPLPAGFYTFGVPINHSELGPMAIPLTPDPKNQMFGRGDFYCHGDSLVHPGFASDGCIVMISSVREQISMSEDKQLQVI
jgi:Protein of unknown function (DUF2778)